MALKGISILWLLQTCHCAFIPSLDTPAAAISSTTALQSPTQTATTAQKTPPPKPIDLNAPPPDLAEGLASLDSMASSMSVVGTLGRDPPSAQGKGGNPQAQAAAPQFGGRPMSAMATGLQGGMPYDRRHPQQTANITSISGTGDASAMDCYNTRISWSSMINSLSSHIYQNKSYTHTWPAKTIPTRTVKTILTSSPTTTSTRCDGVIYPPTVTMTTVTLTFNDPWVTTIKTVEPPSPSPTCSVVETKCMPLWNAFSTATYNYLSSYYSSHFAARATGLPSFVYFEPHRPPCIKPLTACPSKTEVDKCNLGAHSGTVFYWPTSIGDFCGAKTAIFATPTINGIPNTAIFRSTTITSPTVVVLLPSITRSIQPPASLVDNDEDISFRACGQHYHATLLVDPKQLSSYVTSSASATTFRQNKTWATRYTTTSSAIPFQLADLDLSQVPLDHGHYDFWESCADRNVVTPSNQTNNSGSPAGSSGRYANSSSPTTTRTRICEKAVASDRYQPALSVPPLAPRYPDLADCAVDPIGADFVTYVPITDAHVGLPAITHWGAQATVGPKTAKIEPGANGRWLVPTPTVEPFPEGDIVPAVLEYVDMPGVLEEGWGVLPLTNSSLGIDSELKARNQNAK